MNFDLVNRRQAAALAAAPLAAGLLGFVYCLVHAAILGQAPQALPSAYWAAIVVTPSAGLAALSVAILRRLRPAWTWNKLSLAAVPVLLALCLSLTELIWRGSNTITPRMFALSLYGKAPVSLLLFIVCAALAWAPLRRPKAKLGSDISGGSDLTLLRASVVQSAGNYVCAYIDGRERLERMTLDEAEAKLKTFGFVRVHRTALVRWTAVTGYQRHKRATVLNLEDGRSVVVGRRRLAAVRRHMLRSPQN